MSSINNAESLRLVDVPQQLQTPSPEFGARRVLPPTDAKCRIVDVDAAVVVVVVEAATVVTVTAVAGSCWRLSRSLSR